MPTPADSPSMEDEVTSFIDHEAYDTSTPPGEQVLIPATASSPSIDEDSMSFIEYEAYSWASMRQRDQERNSSSSASHGQKISAPSERSFASTDQAKRPEDLFKDSREQ
jgi:hypothetical protein